MPSLPLAALCLSECIPAPFPTYLLSGPPHRFFAFILTYVYSRADLLVRKEVQRQDTLPL